MKNNCPRNDNKRPAEKSRKSFLRSWQAAFNKYFLCKWMALLFVVCIVPTIYFSQKATEYGAISLARGHSVWEDGIRLVQFNKRQLTDGSQLTMTEHLVRLLVLCFISFRAVIFWVFVLTYLNMKLHGDTLKRITETEQKSLAQ
jgi:hypothetical protein